MIASRVVANDVVETLHSLGVGAIFTLCGNHILPIYEILRHTDIRVIGMRSEGAAVMAADAYSRMSRKVGVVLIGGGSAHANAMGGLATAAGNASAVVLLSGESDLAGQGRGGQQVLDHVVLAAPLTKWSHRVLEPKNVREALLEAFRVARGGRPGPVHLSLPSDVLRKPSAFSSSEPPSVLSATPELGRPSPAFVRAAADLVLTSRRPAIVVGAGMWMARGEGPLRELLDGSPIPLFNLDSARGIVPDDHPSVFGSADAGLNSVAGLLPEADLVLLLGRDADFRLRSGRAFGREARLVVVDAELGSLGRNLNPTLACVADPAQFVDDLTHELADFALSPEWMDRLSKARSDRDRSLEQEGTSNNGAIHPAAAARAIRHATNNIDVAQALDCGDFVQWCRMILPTNTSGRWLRLGAQATCGAGLPFGMGAQVALPRTPSLVIAGDGGMGYHVTEFETAVREGLNLTVVVGVDSAWGLEQHLQNGIYGEGHSFASALGWVDFAAVAKGFGATGVHADTTDDLQEAVRNGLSQDGVVCVQVPIESQPSLLTRQAVAKEKAATT